MTPLRRAILIVGVVTLAGIGSYFFGVAYGIPHDNFDLRVYFRAVNYWRGGNDIYDYAQFDLTNGSLGYTYPPVAAVLMSPMAYLSWDVVVVVSTVAIVLAAAACMYLILRERLQLPGGLMVATVGVATAVGFTVEPLRQTLTFGQVNLYLALLVLVDFLVLEKKGSKWAGVGVGLATAVKLTPAIFILYMFVTGRRRQALTATMTFIAASFVGAILAPAATWQYFTSLLWETNRVGHLYTTMNQSLNGLLARFAAPGDPNAKIWFVLAVATAAYGLRRARHAWMAGDHLAGLTLAGLVGALVSPVSWVHHIFWVIPAVIVLVNSLWSAVARQVSMLRSGTRWQDLDRAGIVRYGLLVLSALPVWCVPTVTLMSVRDTDYVSYGPLTALAGSVQLLWMLFALAGIQDGPAPVRHRSDFASATSASAASSSFAGQERGPNGPSFPLT